MPIAAYDIPHFIRLFPKPPTTDQLLDEMQTYEIPRANANAAIGEAFTQGLIRWAPGATLRAV